MKDNIQRRECYIPFARIICAFAVIMIHINGECFYEFNVDGCWPFSIMMGGGLSFAVPVFLMISGATLIDYSERYSTKEYFKKRVLKIVIPYLFWACIVGKINDNFTGRLDAHILYNFLIWLAGIYLCIPIFTYINKEYREKIIFYIVLLSAVFNFLIPLICSVLNITNMYEVPFEIAVNYLIYPLVGYLIYKNDIPLKWRLVAYFFALIGLALLVGGTYIHSIETGTVSMLFLGYEKLPCLLYSTGVFVLFKQIGRMIKNAKAIQIVENISGYTFSIYLIHWYIIYYLIFPNVPSVHSTLFKLVAPFVTFIICMCILYPLKKIKFLRMILP